MSSVASEQPSRSLPFLPWAGRLLGCGPGSAQSWKGTTVPWLLITIPFYQGG